METRRDSWNVDVGLLCLRLAVGAIFAVHGGQKLFVFGFGGVAGFMAKNGIPLPGIAGVVVTLVEFLGGLGLILGLFTRVAAALVAIDMLVAIVVVHVPRGFFTSSGGFEFPLMLLAANVCLALLGAGAISLDAVLFGRERTEAPEDVLPSERVDELERRRLSR